MFLLPPPDHEALIPGRKGGGIHYLSDPCLSETHTTTTRVSTTNRILLHLPDVCRLPEIEKTLEELGFVRIHRSYLVNTARVREIRSRDESQYWEVVLEPPVDRVLPVSNSNLDELLVPYS